MLLYTFFTLKQEVNRLKIYTVQGAPKDFFKVVTKKKHLFVIKIQI